MDDLMLMDRHCCNNMLVMMGCFMPIVMNLFNDFFLSVLW